jgi:ubiquinone/menaquinone biosynthesis C-methylase UbiE
MFAVARRWFCILTTLALLSSPARAQDTDAPKKDSAPAPKAKSKARPTRPPHRDSARSYMGRPIADVMSFEGADWLIRDSREEEEQPDAMIDALKIEPGSTVADVGAGVGYTSMRLAKRVGPKGVVLATDLQPQMIQMLKENMKVAGVRNVKPILCTQDNPKLPEAGVDLILLVDVYHECSDPEKALAGWRKALKPGGRLVLVEFRGEDPDVPIKPEHKMTLAQVRKEVEPQGYKFRQSLEFLPWQHIIIFEKPDKDAKPAEPAKKRNTKNQAAEQNLEQ